MSPPLSAEAWRLTLIGRIDAAVRKLDEARLRPASKTRNRAIWAAENAHDALLRALVDRDERAYLDARLAELTALGAMRGAVVVVEQAPTLRISTRDGLDTLAAAFTAAEAAALRRYRALWDASDPERSLSAVDCAAVRGSRSAGDPFAVGGRVQRARMARIDAAVALLGADTAVMAVCNQDPETQMVVREVAGKGVTIRSLAPGRRRATRLTRKLVAAAGALVGHFR